jgi:hypothetical protein
MVMSPGVTLRHSGYDIHICRNDLLPSSEGDSLWPMAVIRISEGSVALLLGEFGDARLAKRKPASSETLPKRTVAAG